MPSNKIVSEYPSEIGVGSDKRHNQLLHEAIYGIKGGDSRVFDMGAIFSGKKHAQFAVTVAAGGSEIDSKDRFIFFYNHHTAAGNPFQIFGALGTTYPTVPVLDFKKSLEIKAFTNYDMYLRYGKMVNGGAVISLQGKMEQSNERLEYLRKTPMVKLCEAEIAKGNNLGASCQNATISVNMMDTLNLQINYNNVGEVAKLWVSNLYAYVKHKYYYNIKDDWFNPTMKPGSISVSVKLTPDLTRLNGHVFTPSVNIYIKNLYLSYWTRTYIAMNPTIPKGFLWKSRVYDDHSKCSLFKIHIFLFLKFLI